MSRSNKYHFSWAKVRLKVSLHNLCTELWHLGHNIYVDGIHLWNNKYQNYSNNNLGDDLTFPLMEWLTGKKAIPIRYTIGPRYCERLLCIGSILEQFSNPHAIVWGAGLICAPTKKLTFKKITAVRGPQSRHFLLEQGLDCPAVYGDPAILMPRIYTPSHIEKAHKIGLIHHYCEYKHPFVQEWKRQGHFCLDIRHYGTWQSFIDQLCSCEAVISSSLHGIILANAYGIPARHIHITDKIIGGEFKFKDYYSSFRDEYPTTLSSETMKDENDYLALANEDWLPTPQKLGDDLLKAFPFPIQKAELK